MIGKLGFTTVLTLGCVLAPLSMADQSADTSAQAKPATAESLRGLERQVEPELGRNFGDSVLDLVFRKEDFEVFGHEKL